MSTKPNDAGVHGEKGSAKNLNRYFVVSNPDGGWWIVQEGKKKRLQRVRSKTTAIETTRLIARHHTPSEVLVETQNGGIELRYTYKDTAID
ncbi:MAG TPA: DUF2188 domain-containing protein [Tepidisphaeraceae bacterium]|nr:DUF2188 domain-containing protein [Tepidisphaeraceae bacterium]